MKAWTLALLLSSLAARADFLPASFSADYEESFISSATGKERKSFGRIDYQYPRRIFFEVVSPDPTTFVSNSQTSWHYTPPFIEGEEGNVTVQGADELPLTKFLDALKHGTKSNSAYTTKAVGQNLTLSFSPAFQKQLQMSQAVLLAAGDAVKATALGDFKELLLEYKNGKKVRMKFLAFRPGVSFPADHFDFKIPPKTKITKSK